MERGPGSCVRLRRFDFTLDDGERHLAVIGGGGRGHDALEHRERRALVAHDGDFAFGEIFLRGEARAGVVLLLELVTQRRR